MLNLLIVLAIFVLIAYFVMAQLVWTFWAIAILSFIVGITLIIPIGRRGTCRL